MALQKNFLETKHLFDGELIIPNAYFRVDKIILTKDKINFETSVNRKNADLLIQVLNHRYACDYNLQGANPVKQAYEYLKTLPEFAGATDC